MTTPAGWYDDGSGRQRWWDGNQWTEHFAPVAEDAAATVPDGSATDAAPEETLAPTEILPPYAAASDYSPTAVYEPAPAYSPTATYPPATGYAAPSPGYPIALAYAAAPAEPKPMSILGLIGLGLAVIGVILACIPAVMIAGWIVLFAGFVISIVSLFLKGQKWPGITGLVIAVVGSIVAFVIFAVGAVNTVVDSIPTDYPTYSSEEEPSDSSSDGSTASGGRPRVEELKPGIVAALVETGTDEDEFTDAQITCFAQAFVDSDLDGATLRAIAEGADLFDDPSTASAFLEVWGASLFTCATAQ
ncbi:DUF2510 domain-containing protein [Microbacterium sp.]|uniref:DUF2510 domain-containing protein n=1 Tax=Microbacterium sp. TaxID=51671 RepID=UPI0039E3AC5A